jgi:hypothetical protein
MNEIEVWKQRALKAERELGEALDHLDYQKAQHDETKGYRQLAELDRDAAVARAVAAEARSHAAEARVQTTRRVHASVTSISAEGPVKVDLDALMVLSTKGSAPPWSLRRDCGCGEGDACEVVSRQYPIHASAARDREQIAAADYRNDAELIVEARNALPALVSEVLRLRWRLDTINEELRRAAQEAETAKSNVKTAHASRGDIWFWAGDGHDDPGTLSCPVVMSADTLRAILGGK